MYGIVNKAIEELICEHFGTDKWEEVKQHSGVNIDFFMSNDPYDDDITYKLATSASHVLNLSIDSVLNAFGEYWVLNTGKRKYGMLMESGGHNLQAFIHNLPAFHNRISLIYPKLAPPEFKIVTLSDTKLEVHYFSHRPGLQEFMRGLLSGLGKFFNENISIDLIQSRNNGFDHDVFEVSWV